ncbi:MAG: hypothetical protein ACP5GC_08980, partial [Thiomonas sp.]
AARQEPHRPYQRRRCGGDVAALWVALRSVAEAHVADLQVGMQRLFSSPERLTWQVFGAKPPAREAHFTVTVPVMKVCTAQW